MYDAGVDFERFALRWRVDDMLVFVFVFGVGVGVAVKDGYVAGLDWIFSVVVFLEAVLEGIGIFVGTGVDEHCLGWLGDVTRPAPDTVDD